MIKTTALIDANNLLWRYLSVMPDPVKAVSSFLKTVCEIDRKTGIAFGRKVVVVEPLVKDRDGEYKAHRKEVAPEVAAAFQTAIDLLPHLDHHFFYAQEVEADRVLASFARHAVMDLDEDVFIVTSDKDLCQLVRDPFVSTIRPEKDWVIYREDQVLKRYKVPPDRLALYLTLAGDKSDNIPNVPGWGEVNAARAANQASGPSDLEGLRKATGIPAKLMAALEENWEKVVLHYGMIDLRKEPALQWPDKRPDRVRVREIVRKNPHLSWMVC